MSERIFRRNLVRIAMAALLLPPFLGGTLMGIAGFYPLPEFYLVFFSYSGPYVATVLAAGWWGARRLGNYLISLAQCEMREAESRARRLFLWMPWVLLGLITVYSIGGALSADLSMEQLGYRHYDVADHLRNQFGIISAVLVTVLPIYFFFTDQVGRFLAPRGIRAVIVPMGVKLSMLGIATPLLVDSLLVSYFYNETGHFSTQLVLIWLGLLSLACVGTWMAWRSVMRSMAPVRAFLARQVATDDDSEVARLVPSSLDEFGVLSDRFGQLLNQQRQLVRDLEMARTLSSAAVEQAGALVVVLDRQGRMVRFNQACERLSGFEAREVLGKYPWDTMLPPEEAEQVRQQAFEVLARHPEKLAGHYTNHWQSRDGRRYLIEWFNTLILDADGTMEFMVAVGVDITERQRMEEQLRQSEQRYRRLYESMTDAYVQVDMDGRLQDWNPAFQAMLGYEADELAAKTYFDLTPERWYAMGQRIIKQQILPRGYSDVYEKEYVHKDGTVFPVELRTYLLRDDDGTPIGMWALVRDISERKAVEARIASLAYYDALTGLPNRTLFFDRLQLALARARRDSGRLGLLFIDLDKFKPVNDTYGHDVGDQLLKRIAQLIQECVRESDTVGRIGGDEFVVLLSEITSTEDAVSVAQKIHVALRQPMEVGAYRLEVSSCIGVAVYPEHGRDETALMKHADDAMYHAKEAGRDRVALA